MHICARVRRRRRRSSSRLCAEVEHVQRLNLLNSIYLHVLFSCSHLLLTICDNFLSAINTRLTRQFLGRKWNVPTNLCVALGTCVEAHYTPIHTCKRDTSLEPYPIKITSKSYQHHIIIYWIYYCHILSRTCTWELGLPYLELAVTSAPQLAPASQIVIEGTPCIGRKSHFFAF